MKTMEEVATHVLIPMRLAEQLKKLSRTTRVTQSEYLREAVTDLLSKYLKPKGDNEPANANGAATHD